MPGAQIAFNQVGNPIPFGTPGVARDDIWQLNPVACQSTLPGNVTYQWQFLDVPPGSGASFTGGNTATATFTPDLLGTYRIQLTTNGGGLGNVMILVIRVRYNNVGSLQNSGICLPAFGERVGEDNVLIPPVSGPQNARGYAPFFEVLVAYILTLSGGGGGNSYSLDCSAGGIIAYNGPLPVPPVVFLTGTPPSGTSVTWPAASFVVTPVNLTGEIITTGGIDDPNEVGILPIVGGLAPVTFTANAGGTVLLPMLPSWGATACDLDLAVTPSGVLAFIPSIAGVNTEIVGAQPSVQVYTTLNMLDAESYGGAAPGVTGSPGSLSAVRATAGSGFWNQTSYGTFLQDEAGNTSNLLAPVQYQNNPWNTQLMLRGAGSSPSVFGCDFGDTLTGASAQSTVQQGVWTGITGNANAHARIVFQGRVVSSTGATETAGDTVTIVQDIDLNLTAGVMTVINGTQTTTSQATVGGSAGTISNVTLVISSIPNEVQYLINTPSPFDPSTVFDWAMFFFDVATT